MQFCQRQTFNLYIVLSANELERSTKFSDVFFQLSNAGVELENILKIEKLEPSTLFIIIETQWRATRNFLKTFYNEFFGFFWRNFEWKLCNFKNILDQRRNFLTTFTVRLSHHSSSAAKNFRENLQVFSFDSNGWQRSCRWKSWQVSCSIRSSEKTSSSKKWSINNSSTCYRESWAEMRIFDLKEFRSLSTYDGWTCSGAMNFFSNQLVMGWLFVEWKICYESSSSCKKDVKHAFRSSCSSIEPKKCSEKIHGKFLQHFLSLSLRHELDEIWDFPEALECRTIQQWQAPD